MGAAVQTAVLICLGEIGLLFKLGAQLTDIADRVWVAAISVWLVFMILFGGTGFPSQTVFVVQSASALVILLVGTFRLWRGFPSGTALYGAVLAALALVLVLAQLWPIPFELWRSLPGRDIFVRGLQAADAVPASLPMSLSPFETRASAMALVPPLAAFIAALSVPRRCFWQVATAILLATIVGMVIALMQKRGGVESGLYFYLSDKRTALPSGTFANKNFFAAQLYAAIPVLAAFAMAMAQKFDVRPLVTLLFTLLLTGLIVAILALTGSRAGTMLAMVSLLLTVFLVLRLAPRGRAGASIGGGIIAAVVALVVMAQASMVGILRLAEGDTINDFRSTISDVSMTAAKAQFPWGSGFGTFVPVYQLYETPETIIDPYVNYAHNEWLQLGIEGGLPALVLLGLFLLWLLVALVKALRIAPLDPANAMIRASGLVVVLLLVHAIVDFPFRNAALLTLLGLSLGFLSLATAAPRKDFAAKPRAPQPAGSRPPRPRSFTPAQKRFGAAPKQGAVTEPPMPTADRTGES